MPSCVSATIAAASGAGALGDAAGLDSLSTLFSSSAPETLNGRVVAFEGEFRGADNIAQPVNEALAFGKNGASSNKGRTFSYTRKNDKSATIASAGDVVETYRLAFTSGSEGSYTYERRGGEGGFATGEGSFSIK